MVKSLQSGCFMSSDHVLVVLKDCLDLVHGNSELQRQLGQSDEGVPALIKIMNRFEDSALVQEWTCAILRDLCANHDENRSWIASQGGVQAVLVALLKHEYAISLQIAGLAALANLSINEATKLLVPEMSGLEVLKTCMDAYVDNMAIQIQGCRVITALAQVPANTRALTSLGLTKCVVQTMKQSHAKHQQEQKEQQEPSTQSNETIALPDTASSPDSSPPKCNSPNGKRKKLTNSFKNYRMNSKNNKSSSNILSSNEKDDDETLQYHACAAIWALTYENALNRGHMAAVIPYVLVAMKTYESNAAFQAIACGALWNLTTNHPENAQQIVSYEHESGIRIILNALKGHPADPSVQEAACAVLKNLSVTVEQATFMGHAGAIGPILNAMRQHESSPAVQAEGCSALCNLAMAEDHKAPILNAGGIGMIVFAMRHASLSDDDNDNNCSDDEDKRSRRRRREEEVQKHACQALKTLALDNEQNKVSIAASGGIAAILNAMERFPDHVALQAFAVNALQALTEIHRNRAIVLSHGGVATLQATMNKHQGNAYLNQRVSELLGRLSDP